MLLLRQALRKRVEQLREFCSDKPFLYVMLSGGKDSTASLLLADAACHEKLIPVFVSITGNTHPLWEDWIETMLQRLGYTGFRLSAKYISRLYTGNPPFYVITWHHYRDWHEIRWWNFRACHFMLKQDIFRRMPRGWRIVGTKAHDSPRRAGYIKSLVIWKWDTVLPIWDFTDTDVWETIRFMDPCIYRFLHRFYELAGGSGDCIQCPYRKPYDRIVNAYYEHEEELRSLLEEVERCPKHINPLRTEYTGEGSGN